MAKTNPFYTWLTPLLAIALTVVGFMVLRPEEPTVLYWVNMGYVLLLEGIFFGWFHIGKMRNTQTGYFSVFLGVVALYYIIGSLLWLALYTLLLQHYVGVEWYLIGIGVLSVGWLVLASIVGRQDTAYHALQNQLEENTAHVRRLVDELRTMADTHSTPQTERAWKKLIREAESLPPKQATLRYQEYIQKAKKLIEQ